MRAQGVEMSIVSLHGGEKSFEGMPVMRFSKWRLLSLVWRLPLLLATRRGELNRIRRAVFSKPPFWLSFWENLLGLGAAIVDEKRIRLEKADVIHCAWASAPAAYGWMASNLTGVPFTTGAHAYDVFEHGGDWMLAEKLNAALLVHTSTAAAEAKIEEIVSKDRIRMIHRGLNVLPDPLEVREQIGKLRIVCVARLVEKKGFPYQFTVYAALKKRGVAFEAMIMGEGPLRDWMEDELERLDLKDEVALLGRVSQEEVMERLQWADVLLHTGIVAKSGDRDGLPNVVPEAMASGVVVIGSPVSGVVEAVEDGENGFLADVEDAELWVERCLQVRDDFGLRAKLARNARDWVEGNFVAEKNTGRLLEELKKALEGDRRCSERSDKTGRKVNRTR